MIAQMCRYYIPIVCNFSMSWYYIHWFVASCHPTTAGLILFQIFYLIVWSNSWALFTKCFNTLLLLLFRCIRFQDNGCDFDSYCKRIKSDMIVFEHRWKLQRDFSGYCDLTWIHYVLTCALTPLQMFSQMMIRFLSSQKDLLVNALFIWCKVPSYPSDALTFWLIYTVGSRKL